MIQSINNQVQTQFFEGSRSTGCMQKLSQLIALVKNAIVRFFQSIYSCLFGEREVTEIQPRIAIPLPQQAASSERVSQTAAAVAAVLPQAAPRSSPIQQPVIPDAPPLVQQQVPQQQAPNFSPARRNRVHFAPQGYPEGALREQALQSLEINAVPEEKKEDGVYVWPQIIQQYWKMKTADRLDLLKEKLSSTEDVRGRKHTLSPLQTKGAFFAVLEAIDLLWSKVEEGRDIPNALLDLSIRQGIACLELYQVDHKDERASRLPFEELLATEFNRSFKPEAITRKQAPSVRFEETAPANQVVQRLINNAKDKHFFAAALVAKEPVDNPPVFGVFAKYNADLRTADLYLIDPYGGGGNPMIYRKFSQGDLTKYLLNESGYSCLGLMQLR